MAHTGTLYIQEEVAIYSPTINVMCGIYGTGKIFVYTYASFHCPGVLKIGSGMCQHVFNQSKYSSAFLETSVLTVETLVTSHLKILGTESFVNGDVIVQGGDSTFMVSRLIVRGKFV